MIYHQYQLFGRVKEGQQEQTENPGLCLGLLGGESTQTCDVEKAQCCMFWDNAVRVGSNALKPSVLRRGTELCRGYRLSKALSTSNTTLICLRARCGLGNRGQLLQIMKPRRHFHASDEWQRRKRTFV